MSRKKHCRKPFPWFLSKSGIMLAATILLSMGVGLLPFWSYPITYHDLQADSDTLRQSKCVSYFMGDRFEPGPSGYSVLKRTYKLEFENGDVVSIYADYAKYLLSIEEIDDLEFLRNRTLTYGIIPKFYVFEDNAYILTSLSDGNTPLIQKSDLIECYKPRAERIARLNVGSIISAALAVAIPSIIKIADHICTERKRQQKRFRKQAQREKIKNQQDPPQ